MVGPKIGQKTLRRLSGLGQVGSFGPAFAASFVASAVLSKRARTSKISKVALFILAYPISLAIWWLGRPIMMEQTTREHWTDFAIAVLPALILLGNTLATLLGFSVPEAPTASPGCCCGCSR